MKNFICEKCGNTTYIMQEKLNGTGKAIRLCCAQCGTWHKWVNKEGKVLYSPHSAETDKDKEIARLNKENTQLKKSDKSKEQCTIDQHSEIHYWRDRAKRAEEKVNLREKEIIKLKTKVEKIIELLRRTI